MKLICWHKADLGWVALARHLSRTNLAHLTTIDFSTGASGCTLLLLVLSPLRNTAVSHDISFVNRLRSGQKDQLGTMCYGLLLGNFRGGRTLKHISRKRGYEGVRM